MLGNIMYGHIYFFLIVARILSTFLPQTGYIHPDEYFQTFEVLAGKILNVDVNKPWEFNTTFPIRSVFTPYVMVGAGFKLLQAFNYLSETWFSASLITPYFTLITPRLVMCLLSFINDFCLYKICVTNNEKYQSRLIILASSYVIMVYGTRTFTNTIELVLFSILLYYVSESMIFSNIVVKQTEYLHMRHLNAETATEKAQFHKLKLLLPDFSFRNCFIVATLTVVGFFNRPTFIAFAAGPVFFWLYRGMGSISVVSLQFVIRIFIFALCTLPSFLFVIIFDSFYYGYISWGEIGMMDVSLNSFVFTPLNFIRYNADNRNLAQHGIHPRYLHAVVNVPLLFNVLGFLALNDILTSFKRIYEARLNHLPQIKTIKALMAASSLIAFTIFSFIPHQEPRFLIPLLLSLVYLYGPKILKEPELSVIEKPESKELNETSPKKNSSGGLLKLWIFINLMCFTFFGFIHQGGVVQIPLGFNEKLQNPFTQYHLVTCYTYNIPYSLFLQRPRNSFSMMDFNEAKYRNLYLHELGSANETSVSKTLVDAYDQCLRSQGKYVNDCKFFALWPEGLESSYVQSIENTTNGKATKVQLFYPHFSFELLDDFEIPCLSCVPPDECGKESILPICNSLRYLSEYMTLSLYEVTFPQSFDAEINAF